MNATARNTNVANRIIYASCAVSRRRRSMVSNDLTMRVFDVSEPDESLRSLAQRKIDNLNKPLGSLGRLEQLALLVCMAQQTLSPKLNHPCHILYGGDHGIEREGVSATPREVTWQQMLNFSRGGGGVNMFCHQHGFKLFIVDVGVDHDFGNVRGILNRKIAYGTNDFLFVAAMTEQQCDQAINVGVEMADRCVALGSDIICIGEMGVANTSPSSVWMSLMCHIPLRECVGAGSGLTPAAVERKCDVLQRAVDNFRKQDASDDIYNIIRWFGGYEMVAAVGTMLRAAEKRKIVLVDGFIMTACALAAIRFCPTAKSYMVFGHCGDESGHGLLLQSLGARPLLSLGLRLGEGTGALCAYPIVESAVRMINEMNNFENANITKYF